MATKFIAYIDESGDTGLSGVKSADKITGASEWLILSCFLVRAEYDDKCLNWVNEIISQFKHAQSQTLHFSKLLPKWQHVACEVISKKPCRFFVVASNKKNIEEYRNRRAAAVSGQTGTAWLYWWLTRLLLERVTDFCERHTPSDERENHKLRIIFSRRGGLKYIDFNNYLIRLWWQSALKSLHIDKGDLHWSVVDFDEIFAYGHKTRPGLQLADIGAGAFFQALEMNRPATCDPSCGILLDNIVARGRNGAALEYGIKTMPSISEMGLTREQTEIFRHYGYEKIGDIHHPHSS